MKLRNIDPLTVTEGMLTDTNVTEDDHDVWDNAETYGIGDQVIVTTGYHRIYTSLRATNLNHHPATDTSDPPYWQDVGPTNLWAMFDQPKSTSTSNSAGIEATLVPGVAVGGLALIGVAGTTAHIQVKDEPGGVEVYAVTIDLVDADGESIEDVALIDLPQLADAEINVTINGANAALGGLVIGTVRQLGDGIKVGAELRLRDFSTAEEDEDLGTVEFVRRGYAKKLDLKILVQNGDFASVYRWFARVRGKPSVWIGSTSPELSPLVLWGWASDFSLSMPYARHAEGSVQIKSLTSEV